MLPLARTARLGQPLTVFELVVGEAPRLAGAEFDVV